MSIDRQSTQTAATSSAMAESERRVLDSLVGIRYGAVEITIHDGRIVQIERREKLRMDPTPTRR